MRESVCTRNRLHESTSDLKVREERAAGCRAEPNRKTEGNKATTAIVTVTVAVALLVS